MLSVAVLLVHFPANLRVSEIATEDGITLASDALAQLERDNYPYSELSDGKCPAGVDPCSKEVNSHR